ncbi:MAG: hypothetical protein WC975_08075 [Phycisphaerae bacterium]
MKIYKTHITIMAVCIFVGLTTWLLAAGPTTKSTEDISNAQQAMQKLLEQGPPITSPSVPAGSSEKEELSARPKGKTKHSRSANSFGSPAKSQIKHKLLPEGHYVADRRGRLNSTNDYSVFIFESDGKILADPPVKVLPNRWLEKMETDVAAGHESIIFRISGEITTYRGQNFILLRKVLMEREPAETNK